MAINITSSVPQKENQTIDMTKAFVHAWSEKPTYGYYFITFKFKEGDISATWKYSLDQFDDFESDLYSANNPD